MVAMQDSNNAIPPFTGQTSLPASNKATAPSIVNDQRLNRQTLTRTLSGDSLLEVAHSGTRFIIRRPRTRGATTSLFLPEKGSPWVTVPRHHEDTLISTADTKETLLADDGASGSTSLEEVVVSLSLSDDDLTASLTTLLPTPRGTLVSLLSCRCSQVSEPAAKLNKPRQMVHNEKLYENLVQRHGVSREKHPVTRRLSTSYDAPDSLQDSQQSSLRPRSRRMSTSAYQPSPSSNYFQPSPPSPIICKSSILGPITLTSPTTPRDLCLAAIAELEETQDVLMAAWSCCCMTRQPIPPIQTLCNALYNFTFVTNLFTALTAVPCADDEESSTPTPRNHDWIRPEIRAKYLTWRTPIQEGIHQSLGIDQNEDWSAWTKNNHHDQEMYPISPKQQKDLARVCFEASDMLRPLTIALRALLPQQRELAWAKRTQRWRLYLSLKRVVQEHIDQCVRIARCPLTSWLRNARQQACEALGLDARKVPGGEQEEEDGREVLASGALQEENVEDEIDDEEKSSGIQPGKFPRQVRTRIVTFKAQYYFFCLLSPRCSPDKLDELSSKVTGLLLQLEVANISDASLRTELRDLRRSIMERVEKAERAHRRRLGLMDSVIPKMTRPTLHERMARKLKAGWAKDFLNDLDELFFVGNSLQRGVHRVWKSLRWPRRCRSRS